MPWRKYAVVNSHQIQPFPDYLHYYYYWFGFYGPFKNISLISSWSFINGGRKPENPGKNHLAIRKQRLAFPYVTRARLELQRRDRRRLQGDKIHLTLIPILASEYHSIYYPRVKERSKMMLNTLNYIPTTQFLVYTFILGRRIRSTDRKGLLHLIYLPVLPYDELDIWMPSLLFADL